MTPAQRVIYRFYCVERRDHHPSHAGAVARRLGVRITSVVEAYLSATTGRK